MAVSDLFATERHMEVAQRVLEFLNADRNYLTASTSEPRAVGEAIQRRLETNFQGFLSGDYTHFQTATSRRTMADFAFQDREGLYYAVDVKTHLEGAAFSMPNLTSVRRLAEFYRKDTNFFALLLVRYRMEGIRPFAIEVIFAPIEHFNWETLTIGALGQGQLQIKNAANLSLRRGYPRTQWMLTLCERVIQFYERERAKIAKRQAYFEVLQNRLAREDDPA